LEGQANTFYNSFFDAINRRNKQLTTVNITFSAPLNNSNYQALKIQQKVFGSKFKKKGKKAIGLFSPPQFFGLKLFERSLCFDDWISLRDTKKG